MQIGYFAFSVGLKVYTIISTFPNINFPYHGFNNSFTTFLVRKNPLHRPYSSKITNLIIAFIPFYVFPNFLFHKIKKCSKCSDVVRAHLTNKEQ